MPTFKVAPAGIPLRAAAAAAQFGKFGLECLIPRLRRIVGIERCRKGLGILQVGENRGGFRRNLVINDVGTDTGIMHATKLRIARIGQNHRREFQLGLGQRRRIGIRKARRLIIGRIEAIGIGGSEIGDGGLRPRGFDAIFDQSGAKP